MSEPQEEKKKKGRKIIIFLWVLVALLTGASGFLAKKAFVDDVAEIERYSKSTKNSEDRFAKLNKDISKAEELLKTIGITDLDSNSLLQEQVEEVKALRAESEEKIKDLKGQIQSLISSTKGDASTIDQIKSLYAKLKTEVYLLRSEVSKLKAKNQALIAENQKLKEENLRLGNDLDGERKTSAALAEERNGLRSKVDLGRRLVTFDVVAEGIKTRRNGREKPTTRAKRADKIRVVFTIAKNEVTDPGRKDIYLRVVGPDDKSITDGGSSFEYKGSNLDYTAKETIEYQNASTDVYMYAENLFGGQGFAEGDYKVEVYCDNAMIGYTALTLK